MRVKSRLFTPDYNLRFFVFRFLNEQYIAQCLRDDHGSALGNMFSSLVPTQTNDLSFGSFKVVNLCDFCREILFFYNESNLTFCMPLLLLGYTN
eukprot:snap_masked-scaffold_13-processed-gene-4.46-mRNA-1 protein AED:1.00 eAED:1.00 QI:0/0/0/0/1/1/3/0/93